MSLAEITARRETSKPERSDICGRLFANRDSLIQPRQQRIKVTAALVRIDRRSFKGTTERSGDAGLGWRKFDPDQSAIHSVDLPVPQRVTW